MCAQSHSATLLRRSTDPGWEVEESKAQEAYGICKALLKGKRGIPHRWWHRVMAPKGSV